jgi:hypothetical protein
MERLVLVLVLVLVVVKGVLTPTLTLKAATLIVAADTTNSICSIPTEDFIVTFVRSFFFVVVLGLVAL